MKRDLSKMMIVVIVGLVGAIASIVAALASSEVKKLLQSWNNDVLNFISNNPSTAVLLTFVLGTSVGYLISRHKRSPREKGEVPEAAKISITSDEFAELFKQAIASRDYSSIKVFGYTGETVSDYFKYHHKYLENMELRILNRSWITEKADEELHNHRLSSLTSRKWDKAGGIKSRAQEPWSFPTQRTVKYYSTPPFVKAVLLKGPKRQEAFVTFYDWKELPSDGGSQFKGASLSMIHIPGETAEEQKVISYLESQFDYYWKHKSNSSDEVLTEEKKPPRKAR